MRRKLCVGEESTFGLSRRQILNQFGMGLGGVALSQMLSSGSAADSEILEKTHFPAKAKRVIYLFQSGGPSQMDLYDYKPVLKERHGQQLPESVRKGQRLTGMSGNQSSFPLGGSPFKFSQHGQSGQWFSETLPKTSSIADELCIIKSMHTEAINHGPGVTMLQTGSQFPGRPSIGSWLSYGLGTANEDLPSFVVMVTKNKGGQPLVSRLWGSGFLPSKFQGVRLRSGKDPVLYLNNPDGISRQGRRKMLDKLIELHRSQVDANSDPEIESRISEYELAYRMQASVPEVSDISKEPKHILDLYGKNVSNPGSFTANCLQARRLAERGVRFIQLYHPGWDQHGGLSGGIKGQCGETDQASAALVTDLKQRGMLDDTLVVWGGEFGRTCYSQGKLNGDNFGRDHHPRCFSLWMAGGGVKGGVSYGSTDELGYNVESNPVHVHDFHATMLHLLGIDHERLVFRYQGRRFRLTDVHGKIVKGLLA
ncbi:MAG: sulfatase [Verrucomicrobiaceae bacterium TMED76]|nr:MAG: sulfatase [Verrucomicrobiaceae bacterium TMED76]